LAAAELFGVDRLVVTDTSVLALSAADTSIAERWFAAVELLALRFG
jgi:hypothetical protein